MYQDSGFIFQLKKSEVEGELPAEFINVTEKKGRIAFSTLDLVRPSFWTGIFLILVFIDHKEKTEREDEGRTG